jgi:hypothetical protein
MAQTYLLAYLMVIPVGLLVLIFWRRVPKRALFFGVAIFTVASLLYGVGLLSQQDAVEQRLSEFGSNPSRLSDEALSHAVRLVTGNDYAAARGINAPAGDAQVRQNLSGIAHCALTAMLVIGVVRVLISLRDSASIILLIWFGVPILLMSYVGQPVHPFYQLLGLPAGYALAAWGLAFVFRPHTWLGGVLLLTLLVSFGVLTGINSTRYYQETAAIPGAHGTTALSLEYGLKLGQKINELLPEGGTVYADESPWILSSFAGRTLPVVRDLNVPKVTIIPINGGLYLNTETPLATQTDSIMLPDGYELTLAVFGPGTTVRPINPVDYESEQGIHLLGYDFADDILTTYWRVDVITPETNGWLFTPFAHVFNTAGERIQIVDGEAIPGRLWRAGDIHIHNMEISNIEHYDIQIGQYDAVRGQNVIFLPDYVPTISLSNMSQR